MVIIKLDGFESNFFDCKLVAYYQNTHRLTYSQNNLISSSKVSGSLIMWH